MQILLRLELIKEKGVHIFIFNLDNQLMFIVCVLSRLGKFQLHVNAAQRNLILCTQNFIYNVYSICKANGKWVNKSMIYFILE